MKDPISSIIYAHALYQESRKLGILDQIVSEMQLFQPIMETKQDFRRFIEGPQFSLDEKMKFIRAVLEGKVSQLTYEFILILLRHKRISQMSEIIEFFLEKVDEEAGIQKAQVITAVPMSEDLSNKLQLKLQVLTGKQIRLEHKVDKRILGGVIVNFHNHMIDGSFRSQLNNLRDRLMSVHVH